MSPPALPPPPPPPPPPLFIFSCILLAFKNYLFFSNKSLYMTTQTNAYQISLKAMKVEK